MFARSTFYTFESELMKTSFLVDQKKETLQHSTYLQILDVGVWIRADSQVFIDHLLALYGQFQVDHIPNGGHAEIEVDVYADPENPQGKPTLILNQEPWTFENPGVFNLFAAELILREVLVRVRSFFLFHAGAVAKNGQGIVLSGELGSGKTTLVLELVRRGFSFLSDELAAVGLVDGFLPFPRSLRVRADTLRLLGFQDQIENQYPLDQQSHSGSCRHSIRLQP